jgi:hypothetical protein
MFSDLPSPFFLTLFFPSYPSKPSEKISFDLGAASNAPISTMGNPPSAPGCMRGEPRKSNSGSAAPLAVPASMAGEKKPKAKKLFA